MSRHCSPDELPRNRRPTKIGDLKRVVVDWPLIGSAARMAIRAYNWWTRSKLPGVTTSVQWHYEAKFRRYAFDGEIHNDSPHLLTLETLRIEAPSGGSLRDDPPILAFWIGDDISANREEQLGEALRVVPWDYEIGARDRGRFAFVFLPPQGWRGGKFRAAIAATIHGARETRAEIVISRDLTEDE